MPSPQKPSLDAIERAQRLATAAHRGQHDKAGRPYIEHPARVATYVHLTSVWCGLDPQEQVDAIQAAWMHDVLEDTETTSRELRQMGFSTRVIEAVVLLTRHPHVSSDDYYALIGEHRVARAVKWADMLDNTDPYRLEQLPERTIQRLTKKYDEGAACLKISPTPSQWWGKQQKQQIPKQRHPAKT